MTATNLGIASKLRRSKPGGKGLTGDRRGVTAAEFAILMPVLLAMLLGIFEYGRMLWTQQGMQALAAVTARCVAIASTACATPTSYAANLGGTFGVGSLTASGVSVVNTPALQTNASACSPATSDVVFTQVTLTLTFDSPAAGLLPGLNRTLTAQACYPISGS